jgi:hypothetical protein
MVAVVTVLDCCILLNGLVLLGKTRKIRVVRHLVCHYFIFLIRRIKVDQGDLNVRLPIRMIEFIAIFRVAYKLIRLVFFLVLRSNPIFHLL